MSQIRVLAIFQFYLPFVLPRDTDWPGRWLEFHFTDEHAVARVNPLGPNEPLYRDPAGIQLSKEVVERKLPAPNHPLRLVIGDTILDRLSVEVRKELSSVDELTGESSAARTLFFVVAVRAANAFLAHARIAANSLDPMEIEVAHTGVGLLVLTPQTNIWLREDGGAPLAVYGHGADGPIDASGSGYFRQVTRGKAQFSKIATSIQWLGEYPDLVPTLFLNAEMSVTAFKPTEALLSMATACELAATRYLDGTGRRKDPEVAAVLVKRVSFATKYFKLLPLALANRSFEADNPSAFALIERLYRARNNVAHEGIPYEKVGDREMAVTPPVAREFLAAARAAVEWLGRPSAN